MAKEKKKKERKKKELIKKRNKKDKLGKLLTFKKKPKYGLEDLMGLDLRIIALDSFRNKALNEELMKADLSTDTKRIPFGIGFVTVQLATPEIVLSALKGSDSKSYLVFYKEKDVEGPWESLKSDNVK